MTFAVQCKALKLPEPVAEYRFHPKRRWRFDFAFPAERVAIESQGGLFLPGGGRHNRGAALLREYEKINTAAIMGWRILFTTPTDIANGNAAVLVARCFTPQETL